MRLRHITAITVLGIALTACSSNDAGTTETTAPPTQTTEATQAPTSLDMNEPVMTEQEALEALAVISDTATIEQWRALTATVCQDITNEERPLDKSGDISLRVAQNLWDQGLLVGDGRVPAQIYTEELSGSQMALLILGATQLSCPDRQGDAADATPAIQALTP